MTLSLNDCFGNISIFVRVIHFRCTLFKITQDIGFGYMTSLLMPDMTPYCEDLPQEMFYNSFFLPASCGAFGNQFQRNLTK